MQMWPVLIGDFAATLRPLFDLPPHGGKSRDMSKAFLEIVELPDGRIVLRRPDEEDPLVTLSFSSEAREFLQGRYIDVARAMFHAGLEAAGHMAEEDEGFDAEDIEPVSHTLH